MLIDLPCSCYGWFVWRTWADDLDTLFRVAHASETEHD